jgi:hypothetical protein
MRRPTMRLSRRGLRLGVIVGMLFGGEVSIMKLVVHSRPRGLALCVGQPSACVCEVLLVFDKNIISDYNYSHYGQKETVSNCLCTGS